MAFKTSTCFVDHLWELFAPFLLGVDSVILPDETVKNPASLVQALIRHSITHLTAVPTLLQALVPYLQLCPPAPSHQAAAAAASPDMLGVFPGKHLMALDREPGTDSLHTRMDSNGPHGQIGTGVSLSAGAMAEDKLALRVLISSGEPLTLALAQVLRLCLPASCTLLNLYGCTELAADCTCFDVPPVLSNCSSQLPCLSDKGATNKRTDGLLQGFKGVHDVDVSAPVAQQQQQGLESVSKPASRPGPTAGVNTPDLQPADDEASLHAACTQGSDDDRKQKSNATVSAGWPLTGFAVFILPVTKASEAQHTDRHLPNPTNSHPPSAFASPRPPANSPRLTFSNTTSSTVMSVPAGISSSSSAVSSVPSDTDLHASPSSLHVSNDDPNLLASHPQQQLTFSVAHAKKRKWSEVDSPDEQQQQQHQPQEGHTTKAAVNLLPAGQTGEVVVTGVGLAAGYYRNNETTRQRFLNMDFSQLESQKADISGWDYLKAHPLSQVTCFRTGDLGYLTPDGALHICGRQDLQVKLRGVRVVITDVEAALMSHPAVTAAAACTWPLPANRGLALAAYVHLVAPSVISQPTANIAGQAADYITEELLQWCKDILPVAAVLTSITVLAELPQSAGGKLMRGALPPPAWAAVNTVGDCLASPTEPHKTWTFQSKGVAQHQGPLAAKQGLEGRILELFRVALQHPCLEPSDSFFQAGGDSLVAAAVANALVIHPDFVVAFPTARRLAAALSHGAHVTGVPQASADSSALLSKLTSTNPPREHPSEPMPLLLLDYGPRLPPAVATAGEEEGWQQQTQQALAACSQAGGWVRERSGGLRWAGNCHPANLPQNLCNSPGPWGPGDEHNFQPQQHAAPEQEFECPLPEQPCLPPADKASLLLTSANQSSQQQQQQQQHQSPCSSGASPLKCCWRLKLQDCVDASPVVLSTACTSQSSGKLVQQLEEVQQQQQHQQRKQQQHQQRKQQQQQQPEWVFACSHGGDVVCVEGHSGRAVWRRALPARAEAGLTIASDCQAVVVGCSNGSLYFLAIATGHQLAVVDTGGTIKSPPVVDSWQGWGCLWVASHGRQLVACANAGVVVAQCKVSGPVSAAVAFNHHHRLVFVATLSGQLQAFHVSSHHLSLWPAWTHQASAPIFSTPVVDTRTSMLLVAAVDGAMTALSPLGQPQWQYNLGTQIFAPLCLLSAGQEAAAQEASVAVRGCQLPGSSPQHMLLPGNAASTAAAGITDCDRDSGAEGVTHQEAAAAGSAETAVVVGSAEGELHCISCMHGQQLWKTFMESGISTAATLCDVLSSCSRSSRGALAHTHSQLAVATQTQAEFQAGSLSHGQTPPEAQIQQTCAERQSHAESQAQATQLRSQPQLQSHTDARAGSPTHAQTASDTHAQLRTPAQSKASQLLVTCTNSGAVRVLRLPTGPSATSDGSVLKPDITQTPDSQTSGAMSGKTDGISQSLQIAAAVQMPGDVFSSPVSVAGSIFVGCRDDHLHKLSYI
ncbi:TPA: hypothetical protein ACH3X1_005188 [Trebouxia sp. C0004]